MKKPIVAAIVAVVGLGAAVALATKDPRPVKTSVKLEWTSDPDDPTGALFSGRVKAKHDCQKARKVALYSTYGIAGSGKSNARGRFEIVERHGRARGRYAYHRGRLDYFAVAKEMKITKQNGNKIFCKKGTSERVTAPTRAPN